MTLKCIIFLTPQRGHGKNIPVIRIRALETGYLISVGFRDGGLW